MKEPAREGLLVDGAGAPFAEEDSGSIELLDGTSVAYHAIAPDNASALQRFHHRLSERSIYLRFFAAKPELSDRIARGRPSGQNTRRRWRTGGRGGGLGWL
jgi:acetyltransferase